MKYWVIKAEDETQANFGRYEIVQPIVRCKDCKHRTGRVCRWFGGPVVDPRKFCAWGEKKDEE